MISSSLRTLDGDGASGSSARMSSMTARWRRCKISMIWLSRRVRWTCRGFFTLAPRGPAEVGRYENRLGEFFAHGEYIRLYGKMSMGVPRVRANGDFGGN